METKRIAGVQLTPKNIQTVRLVLALLESDYEIHLEDSFTSIMDYLQNYFTLDFRIGLGESSILQNVFIDHQIPLCKVNEIAKPLIFPSCIIERCRAKWHQVRENEFFLSGLITKDREKTLLNWIFQNSDQPIIKLKYQFRKILFINQFVTQFSKIKKKGISSQISISLNKKNKLILVPSTKGRYFPEKSWDEEYFDQLSRSKFVLCPNGDFVWTYRFFEAILCGAIPIIQEETELYDGFFFYKFSDPFSEIIYSDEVVERNFEFARNFLTIRKEKLNYEIGKMIGLEQCKFSSNSLEST